MGAGERIIETVLRLTNEGEYRTALRNCNAELKNLKSGLDLTASQFRNNANSMEALSAKSSILSQTYDLQKQKVSTLREALSKAQETRDKEATKVAELKSKYDEAAKTLASYGDEVDKNSEEYKEAEAAVSKLRDEIIKHSASLTSAEKNVSYYGNQLNKARIELNDLDDKLTENERLLDEARQSADGCATSIDRYGDAVKQAADGTGSSVSAVEALSSAMVAGGIQQKVEDLAAAMMECAEASQEFELAIAKVYTLADESVISQESMKTAIMEIASEMGKGADEIGDAVYDALSAGVDTANVIDFVRQSTQLSIAGFTDAGNAVDVLTTILNAYGLEASQTEAIASKLVKTQDLGKITVDDLGKVMGRVIPTAAAYSVDIDNIATAYANMTASGINAENTTTYLSTMLDELADSGSNVASILKSETGMSFSELMSSGKSLGDVLGILSDSVSGNTTAFSNLWSSSTAGRGALALLNSGVENFNRTLVTMESSTGAVAANYQKMASTSEYASRRVTVASQNLKIAVGNQLNPVLDKLRTAGANILEISADVVAKNPALVAVITGLVSSLGLLAMGLSGLMIVKSVTAAMAALNITMAANPAVLVATAIVGLGVAIATLVAQSQDANEELQSLTEASRALAETVQEANKSYEDTVASTTAAYECVDNYIDRLEELEAQGLKTKDQQIEYAMVVDQINAVMPELNASINEQTGLLEGGTEALRAQAEQWKKTAIQEAVYARYKNDIEALSKAQYEAAKNEALLNNARAEHRRIGGELYEATKKLEKATEELNSATIQEGETAAEFNARYWDLKETVASYADDVRQLTVEQSDAAEKMGDYSDAIDVCNGIIAEQEPLVEAATAALDGLSEGFGDMAQATEDGAQTTSESLEQLGEEYQELEESARDSLDSQFGLFEKVSVKSKQSTSDMIKALQSQKKAFDDYATNITLAIERGVDIGLVQQLSDGSAESMAILAELVTATDEEIAALNESFSGVSEAKDVVAASMAEIGQTITDSIDSAADDAYDSAYGAGADTGNGYIAGLNSKKTEYATAARSFANTGYMVYKQVNQIMSPSKRWKWLGEMDAEGPITAYRQAKPKMEKASTELANSGYAAAIRARQRSMQEVGKNVERYSKTGETAGILPMLKQILNAVKDGKILAINGTTFVGATLSEYDSQMGQQKILAERGAK